MYIQPKVWTFWNKQKTSLFFKKIEAHIHECKRNIRSKVTQYKPFQKWHSGGQDDLRVTWALATVTFKILLSAGHMMRPSDLQHIKERIFSKRNLPMVTSFVWFRLHWGHILRVHQISYPSAPKKDNASVFQNCIVCIKS